MRWQEVSLFDHITLQIPHQNPLTLELVEEQVPQRPEAEQFKCGGFAWLSVRELSPIDFINGPHRLLHLLKARGWFVAKKSEYVF